MFLTKMSPEKRATVVASVIATLLTLLKFVIGIASGSVAVLASAIDSLLDTLISIFNFFAIKKSEEKATAEFQYGKGKVQAIAAVIEGTVITVSGLYIIYEAIQKAIHGTETTLLTPAIWVMLVFNFRIRLSFNALISFAMFAIPSPPFAVVLAVTFLLTCLVFYSIQTGTLSSVAPSQDSLVDLTIKSIRG